ncbi:MAG: DUF1846 domain-containing protein [Erysipelotrichaceae bacterium]|nr:DUF1846 domain-containing protein [Erysipelotrichaceae bacterium]
MFKKGYDNDRYVEMQSLNIMKRIQMFNNKLYLEFGGKLFDDYHASRVLPGFEPDSKIKMLLNIKQHCEVMIVINANDIEKNKIRGDYGITYYQDLMRLIDAFREVELLVGSVIISRYHGQKAAIMLKKKLENIGIQVAFHYTIEDYPLNVAHICSEDGFGRNEYIKTTKPLVIVTAPGPGSGKLATCLSQIYNDYQHGIKSGYAKFETFPIWNIPLKHPVNLAYEAATADLNDINMIDPFHLEAYNIKTVNYNRDVESFPILNTLLEKILGTSPYKSPTDMGVNMVGYCITDEEACKDASKQEILRRYYDALVNLRKEEGNQEVVNKIENIMTQANIDVNYRSVALSAQSKADETNEPACAIELADGRIITGKTSKLLGSASACLLNALKTIANIDDDIELISPKILIPIQELKTNALGGRNPRLHTDEVLIALAIEASNNPIARKAYCACDKLKHCEMHSTVILSEVDINTIKKLKINITQSPIYQSKRLYHKK